MLTLLGRNQRGQGNLSRRDVLQIGTLAAGRPIYLLDDREPVREL